MPNSLRLTVLFLLAALLSAQDANSDCVPVDVAWGDGKLYVLATEPPRVLVVDLEGGAARVLVADEPPVVPGGPRLGTPTRMEWLGGTLYLADAHHHRVMGVDPGTGALSVVVPGDALTARRYDAPTSNCALRHPGGLAMDAEGRLVIADTGNDRIRRAVRDVASGKWAVEKEALHESRMPMDVAISADGAFAFLHAFHSVHLRAPKAQEAQRVPGTALEYERSLGSARADRLPSRRRFELGPDGGVLLIESAHHRIRRVDAKSDTASNLAGTGVAGYGGDGGPADRAQLRWPTGLAHAEGGDVFIADSGNHCVRRVAAGTGIITTVLGAPPASADGGRAARRIEVLKHDPDPAIVTDSAVRDRIAATGAPWKVRHVATGIECVLVPAGRYRRGVGPGDEDVRGDASPAHTVEISRPFYLGRCEVTNAQYRRFDPSHTSYGNGPRELTRRYGYLSYDGPDQPAINLSWFDAAEFCDRFALRLPTEGEWEYAARAGATTPYQWGNDADGGAAWANLANPAHAEIGLRECRPTTADDGHFLTAPVGTFRPNGFGLHDMVGNAWEWTADWYASDTYTVCRDGVVDPRGPMVGVAKVLRGSSWRSPFVGNSRLSFRGQTTPDAHLTLARGFRVVSDLELR